ncbi:hypothetical protein AERO9A_380063 [Aeromonas salmonicida]|nr:hypothetical protein AERO9A_380063 [Aeromonas salmonicida]
MPRSTADIRCSKEGETARIIAKQGQDRPLFMLQIINMENFTRSGPCFRLGRPLMNGNVRHVATPALSAAALPLSLSPARSGR